MLTILVQPILKCMHFLHITSAFILNISFCIGRAIIFILLQACNIVGDILTALSIVAEELYSFVCELDASIGAVITYMSSTANGGINCVLEAVTVFVKHLANFFVKTRLHSKLLATHIGRFIGEILYLLRNALLLIADCAWWLITLLPRRLLSAIIAVGDFLVETITMVRKALFDTVQIIVEDVFRLTIGITILFLFWHNRRRLAITFLRSTLKVMQFIKSCCLYITLLIRRVWRSRVHQIRMTPVKALGFRKRSPHIPSTDNDNILDFMQRCVICKDRQKCILLLPCKHLCLCEECSDLVSLSHTPNCPLCRKLIDHSMSVYI